MKLDKKTITIMVLSLLLVGITGVFAHNYITVNAYEQGFNDANIFINKQIQTNLENYGFITFNYPINENETILIKLIPYQDEK